jgi:transcriptional regulator GlxA family with amidase domain
MKSILIIIAENCVISNVTDTVRFFAKANELLKNKGVTSLFDVQTIGFSKTMWLEEGRLSFHTDKTLDESGVGDLIIIPSVKGDVITNTQLNRHYFPWLINQYKKGAQIACYSTGSFILAATGLLREKECAVNPNYSNEFDYYYHYIPADTKTFLKENKGVYTCSGETMYWHLLLRILYKCADRQLANDVASYFSIDNRVRTEPGCKPDSEDALIQKVQQYIAEYATEKITASLLAKTFFVHKRTLERRFLRTANESLGNYIQKQKIEVAKKALQSGYKTIQEVMLQTGYSDSKTFRLSFKKVTGILPIEYANMYRCPLWSKGAVK